MLTDNDKILLRQQMVPVEDIANIIAYDTKNQEVTFNDGTVRTLCECWTRCMGYYRPASFFNRGKQSEYNERKWFTEMLAKSHMCPCEKAA